ncbi:hypothetical protein [Halpernia sp. GG3]
MKYLLLLALSIISCKTSASKSIAIKKTNEMVNQKSAFSKLANSDNSYTLYYKIEKNSNSPVKLFTYYVTDNKTNKILKTTEQIAAEKIFWKDDHTLAIIPYTEMIPKNDVVGEPFKIAEILINIK